MMWFDIIKGDFKFQPGETRRGGYSRMEGAFVNLSSFSDELLEVLSEEQVIESIVNTLTHETTHQAFGMVAEDEYFNEPLQVYHMKLAGVYKGALMHLLKESATTPDLKLIELNPWIEKLAAYDVLNELFASEASNIEGAPRMILERYVEGKDGFAEGFEKIALNSVERIHEAFEMVLEQEMKDMESEGKDISYTRQKLVRAHAGAKKFLTGVVTANVTYMKNYSKKLVYEVLEGQIKLDIEPGDYMKLLRDIVSSSGGPELLREYARTGNIDLIRRYI